MSKRTVIKMSDKVYLGDGAYAEWDGYSVWVSTSNGILDTNRICLGPTEFTALLRFASKHWNPETIARFVLDSRE